MIIYKYPLAHGVNTIKCNSHATLQAVAFQNNKLFAWICQDDDSRNQQDIKLKAIFTGESFNEGDFILSAVSDHIVYHVYQIT